MTRRLEEVSGRNQDAVAGDGTRLPAQACPVNRPAIVRLCHTAAWNGGRCLKPLRQKSIPWAVTWLGLVAGALWSLCRCDAGERPHRVRQGLPNP